MTLEEYMRQPDYYTFISASCSNNTFSFTSGTIEEAIQLLITVYHILYWQREIVTTLQ